MLKNYLKTAYRALQRHKGFTAINVLGLTLGLGTCLLILTYVFDELSYDRYNTRADRIYRVNNDIKFGGNDNSYAIVPAPLAGAIKNDLPEVEQVVRFASRSGAKVRKDNQQLEEDKMVYADSSLFEVFSLPLVEGDPVAALKQPYSVVITESTAKKYFGKTDVVGKTLVFDDTLGYKVTGVIKDIPVQSHFRFDFFISMSTLAASREDAWLVPAFTTYLLLRPGVNVARLEAKLPDFFKKEAGPQLMGMLHQSFEAFEQAGNSMRINLTPLKKIHLESNRIGELGTNGNAQYVWLFSGIALFILLLACINFMNLSTARSAGRAKEVGVRKVLGSTRASLVVQFLSESILVTLAGAVLAVIAAWTLLPLFNELAGKELAFTPQLAKWLAPTLLGIVVLTGVIAGSYPAFFLSRFRPIAVLKGRVSTGFKGSRLRSALVVFQFSITIFLIIGTLVIYNQLNYIQARDLGYNREQVLVVNHVSALGDDKARVFKEQVLQLTGVQNATLSGFLPTSGEDNIIPLFKDPVFDPKRALKSQIWYVDEDWVTTLGIRMAAGRNFSKVMPTDSSGMILNETAARLLGYADPLNKKLYEPQDNMGQSMKDFHVIGVMKNFNFKSLRENVTPLILVIRPDSRSLSLRVGSARIPEVLAAVKRKWAALSPNEPFRYSFMDQDFDALYRSEERMGGLFVAFAILASLIACLGLFGLATYAMEQRLGEIVIRKVLGASVPSIARLLSKDFIRLVLIAIVVASPIAWLVMSKWLEAFAYRKAISVWVVVLAGSAAISVAVITVSLQSIKAALLNPARGLRSE